MSKKILYKRYMEAKLSSTEKDRVLNINVGQEVIKFRDYVDNVLIEFIIKPIYQDATSIMCYIVTHNKYGEVTKGLCDITCLCDFNIHSESDLDCIKNTVRYNLEMK